MNQRVAVAVVYVLGLFVSVLDVTIVNVALPSIGRSLDVGTDRLGSVSVGYLVAVAVVIPVSGWLGDKFGGAPVLLSAIAVFTAASAACGLADTLSGLVLARIAQGFGGGLLAPVGLTMLYRAFPPGDRTRVLAKTALVTAAAPVLGPVLGGALLSGLSWRWIFFVNVPIGVAAVVFGLVFLQRQQRLAVERLDVVGLALSATGLAGFMFGLTSGPEQGWSAPTVLVALVAGPVLLVVLVWTQLRAEEPLLRLRLLDNRLFRLVNAVVFLGGAAFFGALFVLALYLQDDLGLSPASAGLLMLAEAVPVLLGAQLASRVLYRAVGPRRLLLGGLLGVAAAAALLGAVGPDLSRLGLVAVLALLGLSWSQVFIPASVAAFAQIVDVDTGRASTLSAALRQVGTASGIAIVSVVSAAARGSAADHLRGSQAAFYAAAGLAVAAAGVAAAIRDADADSTRRPPP